MKTSRDRPKSAPYLMFKNSKRTSIKVPKYSLLQNPIFLKSHNVEKTESEPLGFFNIHYAAKFQKIEGNPLEKFFLKKSLTMPKKTEGGDPLVSPDIVCYAEMKNLFVSVPWATRSNLNFCTTFGELFWSLKVYQKNTDEKL